MIFLNNKAVIIKPNTYIFKPTNFILCKIKQ